MEKKEQTTVRGLLVRELTRKMHRLLRTYGFGIDKKMETTFSQGTLHVGVSAGIQSS